MSTNGKPCTLAPRQRIWNVIREHAGKVFSGELLAKSIQADYGIALDVTFKYLKGLTLAGILERTPESRNWKCRSFFRLAQDKGWDAPRAAYNGKMLPDQTPTELMWRVLTLLPEPMSHDRLAAHASTVNVVVSLGDAAQYLAALFAAGYLEKVERRGGLELYRLKAGMNTGPRAPFLGKVSALYDPNTHVSWAGQFSAADAEEQTHGKA
jgi:hypothetical protein